MIKQIAKTIIYNIPDGLYIRIKYFLSTRKILNLSNPKSFTEKLQWLKLYDRNPLYVEMVDKLKVREIVLKNIGEEYLIPLLKVYNSPSEINFSELPNQFVIKCTHDSGGVIICDNKEDFNFKNAISVLKKHYNNNYYYSGREWPYKNVKPKIICEKYMKDNKSKELIDYKIYCFNGKPKFCQVIQNRSNNETIDFYDMHWNHQEFVGLTLNVTNAKILHKKPINFDLMIRFSKILSNNIPFVRIDFYEINNKLYFGEITFYPASGFGKFVPDKWDKILGEYIDLSNVKQNW